MNKVEKKQVVDSLKEKFLQYNNFYVAETESMSVEQISKLRHVCFSNGVEVKMAKNTLIKRAIEELDHPKYKGVKEELKGVSVLFFSQSPKEPAKVIGDVRSEFNSEKPLLKLALIEEDLFVGNHQLATLKSIKTKQELLSDLLAMLQSPAVSLSGALQNSTSRLAAVVKAMAETAQQ